MRSGIFLFFVFQSLAGVKSFKHCAWKWKKTAIWRSENIFFLNFFLTESVVLKEIVCWLSGYFPFPYFGYVNPMFRKIKQKHEIEISLLIFLKGLIFVCFKRISSLESLEYIHAVWWILLKDAKYKRAMLRVLRIAVGKLPNGERPFILRYPLWFLINTSSNYKKRKIWV